jgi:hypothetical protein
MATTTYFPVPGGTSISPISYAISRLQGLTGIAPMATVVDSSDFTEQVNSNAGYWTPAGTVTQPASRKGGIIQMNTVSASSLIRPILNAGAGTPRLIRATEAWGFRARGKSDGSFAAGAFGSAGLDDDAATVLGFEAGGFGSTFVAAPTKYAFRTYDGVTQNFYASTVTVDTLWHTFDMWYDGVHYYGSVDEETGVLIDVSGGLPASTVYMVPNFRGSTAKHWEWDYFVAITARETP